MIIWLWSHVTLVDRRRQNHPDADSDRGIPSSSNVPVWTSIRTSRRRLPNRAARRVELFISFKGRPEDGTGTFSARW